MSQMLTAALLLMSVVQDGAVDSFCRRVAAETGMAQKKDAAGNIYWDVPALNMAQRLLVGGTAMMSLKAEPLEPPPAPQSACKMVPKGIACDVVGPARLGIMMGDKLTSVDSHTDERATVRVVGIRIRCEDLPSQPAAVAGAIPPRPSDPPAPAS